MSGGYLMLKLLWLLIFGWKRKCKHEWSDKEKIENNDGITYVQECSKCNKLRDFVAEPPAPASCNHKWQNINVLKQKNAIYGNTYAYVFIDRCEKCGEINQTKA